MILRSKIPLIWSIKQNLILKKYNIKHVRGIPMIYNDILSKIEKEFETISNHEGYTVIVTNETYDGKNEFCIFICKSEDTYFLSDIGVIRDIYDRIGKSEWIDLCNQYGFTYKNGRINRELSSIDDVYKFISFYSYIKNKYN